LSAQTKKFVQILGASKHFVLRAAIAEHETAGSWFVPLSSRLGDGMTPMGYWTQPIGN